MTSDPQEPEESGVLFRIERLERLMAQSMTLYVQGFLLSFFMGLQVMLLTLQLTHEINWNWWTIAVPTMLLFAAWKLINWSRRQEVKNTIGAMQKEIHELRRHLEHEQAEPNQ